MYSIKKMTKLVRDIIIILGKMYTNYINAPECQKIESKGIKADKTLTNTKNLYERAAKELYMVDKTFINDYIINFFYKFTQNLLKSILKFFNYIYLIF